MHIIAYHSSSMSIVLQIGLVIWISETQMISLCQFIKWHPLKDFPTLIFQNFGMISLSLYLIHVKNLFCKSVKSALLYLPLLLLNVLVHLQSYSPKLSYLG
jgi:hypothetical protein